MLSCVTQPSRSHRSFAFRPIQPPSRKNILKRLQMLKGRVPRDGLLLVAFSGHGVEVDGKVYLLPSDAETNSGKQVLAETSIAAETIAAWIRGMEVEQVVILLD